jgi:hypothetical protein
MERPSPGGRQRVRCLRREAFRRSEARDGLDSCFTRQSSVRNMPEGAAKPNTPFNFKSLDLDSQQKLIAFFRILVEWETPSAQNDLIRPAPDPPPAVRARPA